MLKKIVKVIVIVLAVGFVIIQFIRPDRNNPPIVQAETLEASTVVPPDVAMVLSRSCADCHTNKTTFPWYSNIAPFSWVLMDHVNEGREHLNLSVWNTYDTRRKLKRLEEICEQVESGEMPLPSYLWIHYDAAMKPGEAEMICSWVKAERSKIEAAQ